MHKLVREVRFSVNPYFEEDWEGCNSYCSNPPGEGLSLFFALRVGLAGEIAESTGFVINVIEIDKEVRRHCVGIFARFIREKWRENQFIGLLDIVEILRKCQAVLADKIGGGYLTELSVMLNPYRKLEIDCEDKNMIYFTEKFEFAATHKLWNDSFSDDKNFEVFGKCANVTGHGHNYILEVTVKAREDGEGLSTGEYERVVDEEFLGLVDHKNLNIDVDFFEDTIPTVENIAVFAWNRLVGKFGESKLHCITVWETDKTYCSYYG